MSMFNVRCRYRTGAVWIALGPVRRQRGWCDLTACGDERVGWVAKMAHICSMECAGGGAQAVREVYLARMRERVGGMCVPQRVVARDRVRGLWRIEEETVYCSCM